MRLDHLSYAAGSEGLVSCVQRLGATLGDRPVVLVPGNHDHALITGWRGQGPLQLPGPVVVVRRYGKLTFERSAARGRQSRPSPERGRSPEPEPDRTLAALAGSLTAPR